MAIVDTHGVKLDLLPRREPIRHVKSPRVRARNRKWLERRRAEGLSIRELARAVRRPAATVARGLKWAEQDEERRLEREIAAERSPVVDRRSGLTADDVRYLVDNYGLDTELGSLPQFWEFLAPLVDKMCDHLEARVSAPPPIPMAARPLPRTFAELKAYRAA